MFNNMTLYQNGAFMMCESISEYDANVPEQGESQDSVKNTQIKQALLNDVSYDITMKLSYKLQPLYERYKDLVHMNITPNSEDEAVTNLDEIARCATMFANNMRMFLIKEKSMMTFMKNSNICWPFEPVMNQLGFYMKNKLQLIRNGNGKITYNVRSVDFLSHYELMNQISLYINSSKGIIEFPMSIRMIDSSNVTNPFTSFDEMFDCYINNMENWFKIESVRVVEESIDDVINRIGYSIRDMLPVACPSTNEQMVLCYLSETLREVSQSCYQLKCAWLDGDYDYNSKESTSLMRSLISKTVNMFIISALVLIPTAYEIQQMIDMHNRVQKCVDIAMESVK